MSNLAIIPARSGSKTLPNKNIKKLQDKPLIAYTINAAFDSNLFSEIMVSTDSEEYATIAEKWGANVPFLRSIDNSDDSSSTWDVVKEVIEKYREINISFDTVTVLQPTSPLRTGNDIKGAYKLFSQKDADAVISVCETDHSPLWTNTIDENLSLYNFIDESVFSTPRQELPKYYRVNGAIYILKTSFVSKLFFLYNKKSYAYIMSKKNSIDIDDELDFMFAETILK